MTLDEMREKSKQVKAQMAKYGKAALKTEFEKFFADNPVVTAIRWRQYTPYFNDGDACVFSVGEPEVKLEGAPEDLGDDEDGFMSEWSLEYTFGKQYGGQPGEHAIHERANEYLKVKKPLLELGKTMCASDIRDVFLTAFDDHSEVTATRKGSSVVFEVEEYQHD